MTACKDSEDDDDDNDGFLHCLRRDAADETEDGVPNEDDDFDPEANALEPQPVCTMPMETARCCAGSDMDGDGVGDNEDGLVETLQGDGPFTVFAPTDAAFEAAGIDLSTFDNDEANATLVDILTYHVLSGAVDAANDHGRR